MQPESAGPRTGLPHGNRRLATVLVADLSGYSRLAERLDPEELAGAMNRLLSEATRVIEAHGGIVNQYSGDDVKALFGVPIGHDDDPQRAVHAAIDLHRITRELIADVGLAGPLALHSGIATGVIVTQQRDQREGLFGVTGDAMNTAARLVGTAGPDEIVIDAATQRAVSAHFETTPLGDVRLRGKQQTVAAFRVVRPIARAWFEAAQHRGLSAHAGRDRELELLEDCLARARAGHGHVVAIEGQPGVGKSRLLYELRARTGRAFRVGLGGCEDAQVRVPFRPFLDLVRDLLEVSAGDPPDAQRAQVVAGVRRLGGLDDAIPLLLQLLSLRSDDFPLPPSLQEAALRSALLGSVTRLIVAAAREQPLLALLEDWHWADESSSEALRQLARAIAEHPIAVVVTSRPGGEPPATGGETVRVHLEPLGLDDARTVIASRLGGESLLDDDLVRRLHERTGGNPLFLEEVCRSMVETSSGTTADEALARLDVPPTVEAVIRARIDRLPDGDGELLRIAAVLGHSFPLPLLEHLAAETAAEVPASLARLAAHELIEPMRDRAETQRVYRFKHAITREVVYEATLRPHRRDLHRRAGEAIEAMTPIDRLEARLEDLAEHYEKSDEIERAAHFAARAADKAAASFTLEAARVQYRRAIALLDRLGSSPDRVRRRVDLSALWAAASVYDPSAARCDVLRTSYELAERVGYRRGAARAVYWMGWFEHAFGNHEAALAHFERAIELADPVTDHRLVSQLHTNLGQSYYHGAEYRLATDHLSRAIELRRGATTSQRTVVVANALGYLGLVDAELGELARAHERVADALSIVRGMAQRQLEGSVLVMVTYVALFSGEWIAAIDHAREIATIADEIGGPYIEAMSRTASGYARAIGHHDASGLADLEAAVVSLEATGSRLSMSVNYACLAEALACHGDAASAVRFAQRAIDRSPAFDRVGEIQAHRALALAMHAEARHDDARARLATALDLAAERGAAREEALTRMALAELALATADVATARSSIGLAIDALDRFGMRWHLDRARDLERRILAGA